MMLKKFLPVAALALSCAAHAAILDITVPPAVLSDGSTVSGSFTFDTTSNDVTNINLAVGFGALAGNYTVLGNNRGTPNNFFYARQTGASGPEAGLPILLLTFTPGSFPATGGAVNFNLARVGNCTAVVGTACVNNTGAPSGSANNVPGSAVVQAAPPAATTPVPTLSQYTLMALAMLVAGVGIAASRRRTRM